MTDIFLHIIDLQSDDINNIFQITIYGKTVENKNVVCHVTDFKPSFYVKIPEKWTKNIFQSRIINSIDKKLKAWEKKYISVEVKSPLYYYDFYEYKYDSINNKRKSDKFVKLVFNNYRSFNKYKSEIKNLFNIIDKNNNLDDWRSICNDECLANLYETNIHPILRFIHSRNISPAGWINISGKSVKTIDDRVFKCDIEYTCKSENIKPTDNMDGLSDIVVASFDIECDSLTGEFPRATKDFKGLASNIYDIYSCRHDSFCEMDHKKGFIQAIIKQAFTSEDIGGLKNDVDPIVTENSIPTNTQKCSILSDEFIENLDNSLSDKKFRNDIIDKIKKILDSELKNSNGELLIIKGDPIIQIGTVFYYTVSKKYVRIIQVIKPDECDKEICDNLEKYDIIVECCKNERELLKKWKQCINRYNPDMITGYNIFGFDFNYIRERANKFFECDDKSPNSVFYNFGRLDMDHENANDHYMKKCKPLNKRLSSSALGDNELKYFNMDGRVLFDVVKEIQKGHNLESYKLDNVASHFMRGKIYDDYKYVYIPKGEGIHTIQFNTNTIGHLKCGDYITINIHSNIGEVKLLDGEKFKISKIKDKQIQIIIDIDKKKSIKKEFKKLKYTKIEWCMNKDDVPPQEIFNLHKTGGPSGRAKVAKYCIQDCELCIHLINLLDIVPNNIGMSNVCLVPFSYIFLRGQGIKVTSIVSKECDVQKTRMPTLKDYKETTDGYEGAIVLEPKTGIYLDDPIAVLDYASLYPSSIIENNLSQDKYLSNNNPYLEKCRKDGTFEEKIEEIEYDDYRYEKRGNGDTVTKVKTGETTKCYFLKDHRDEKGDIIKDNLGIVPTVLQTVLEARKETRKRIKTEPDEFKRKVLDGLQLAYKVTANSVYGQLGAKTSSIYMKKIAACTTSIGRQRIEDADNGVKDWAKSEGYEEPEIVYGDTDSVFIKFSRKKDGNILSGDELLKHCIDCGMKAGEFVDDTLRDPQNLEYEKTFFPFILISKKRYVGDKYEYEPDVINKNFKRTSMGIVLKRRDNAPIVKYVFGNIIEKIMIDKKFDEALQWLVKTLNDIIKGEFPISYFIISKSLRGYYKNPQSIAHKVLADRIGERDPGNKPKSNDRIPYAYVKLTNYDKVFDRNSQYKSGKNKGRDRKRSILQGDRIEHPDFIKSENLKLDYSFYITNQIMNPVKQVLDLNVEYRDKTKSIFDKYDISDDMLYEYMLKYK